MTRINRAVRQKGPEMFLARTRDYWSLWVNKEEPHFVDLPDDVCHLYKHSLMVLRTQIDNDGAVIAANDFDIAHYGRDTYAYMWPRDGALVTAALIEAGYSEATRRFFDFCHRVITEEGHLLHKYNPDGSLASYWHGWYYEGEKRLPVQEDETALVLWAFWRHFQRFRDVEFIKPHYRGLVIRAAEWMVRYRDEESGLPLPSWEQVHPYTNEPLSVSPLTWSHATLVQTVQEYLAKQADLNRCPECGQPIPHLTMANNSKLKK